MKTIGLIGGMSWESTALYYRLINEGVKARLGGFHSAKLVLYSVDFHEIEQLQQAGDWEQAGATLAEAAQAVQAAGADFLVLCTNTMHRVADQIEAAVKIPLLHLADATAEQIKARGFRRIGLLGTRYTMELPFYRGRLEQVHGLEVLVPPEKDRELVNSVIYDELCLGRVESSSRMAFLRVIEELEQNGAEAVIEGCTEIVMLVQPEHTHIPLFDTTAIHADAAIRYALAEAI